MPLLLELFVAGRLLGGGPATQLATQALDAMGGQDRLSHLQQLKAHRDSHVFAVEESERPEGPWVVSYSSAEDTVDFAEPSMSVEGKVAGLMFSDGMVAHAVYSFSDPVQPKQTGFAFPTSIHDARDRISLGPERVLFNALAAKDLHADRAVVFHGIPHDVLEFTWGIAPVRVLLNPYTHLPAAVESVQVGDGYWSIWGDVSERMVWTNWDLAPGGIRFPTIWSFERNGIEFRSDTLSKVEVVYGDVESVKKTWLAPSPPAPEAPARFAPQEISAGIVQYRGGFNCAAVSQDDGIVILEGVVSPDYMKAVMEDVARRFPGKPVKAVISTDDAWPHFGGLRYFAARGTPIYTYTLNEPILSRYFKAPHTLQPDDFSRSHARTQLRLVDGRIEIGTGANRLVLFPMHGAVTERMLYGYFPEIKLLYAPDVLQRSRTGWFGLNMVDELLQALARDEVAPEKAFAFHSSPIPLDVLRKAVADAKAAKG